MSRGVDLGIDREYVSVGTDDVAHPLGVGGILIVTSAVGEPDVPSRVAEKGEVEVELLRKRTVLVLCVEADSQNLGVRLLELPDVVAEPATFGRSAGGIRLGVEPEDDDLPEVVLQSNEIPPMVPHFELGSFLSFLDHGRVKRSPREARPRRRWRARCAPWCCIRGDRALVRRFPQPRFHVLHRVG